GRNYHELVEQVLAGRISDEPAGADVPVWIRDLLLRGLQTNPADRWPSMNALLSELENQPAVISRRRFADAAATKLAATWEVPRGNRTVETPAKAQLRRAFLATGKLYAEKAYDGVCQILDRYVIRWAALYVECCEATHVRGEQSAEVLDLRMACLQEGLEDLTALCRVLQQASPEAVENAVSAANALGNLDRCENIEVLRAIVKPPQDDVTREAAGRLRGQLADLRALCSVGRINEGLAAAGPLEKGVRGIAYAPLLADTLLAIGRLHQENGLVQQAAASYEEALWAAIGCRHDEAATEASLYLLYIAGYLQSRFDVAEIWSRMADTFLHRLGGHDLLRGWFLHHRSAVRDAQGRVTEALDDVRAALAAKERVLAPDHPDLGYSMANLAMYLDGLGAFAEAVEQNRRALAIVEGGMGPDHPRVAVILSNEGEFLAHLGRFDEAIEAAERALAIFERETGNDGLYVSYPLLALGVSHLGLGRVAQALPILERAHRIRDAKEGVPSKRAEARFALARALWFTEAERPRARALAARAQEEYEQSPTTPSTQRDLAAIRDWSAAHA
ncbi:MAG: tetratricopeptide repeat protein, partial [Pseudomonadota bacterium]